MSVKSKCVHKYRKNNDEIVGYRLVDLTGSYLDIESDKLKKFIMQGKIEVVNLTLTSDNRLIDKAEPNLTQYRRYSGDMRGYNNSNPNPNSNRNPNRKIREFNPLTGKRY